MNADWRVVRQMRLDRTVKEYISPLRYRNAEPLNISYRRANGEPPEKIFLAPHKFQPFSAGQRWGRPWETTWFHVTGTLANPPAGKPTVAIFNLGFDDPLDPALRMVGRAGATCEATVWRNSRPWRALTPNHRVLPADDGAVDLYLEAIAFPTIDRLQKAPSMLEARTANEELVTFAVASIATEDPDFAELAIQFSLLLDLAKSLDPQSARMARIMNALGEVAEYLELNKNGSTSGAQALGILSDVLSAPAAATEHRVSAVGHAHIDMSWLWPREMSHGKVTRTFSNVADLMSRNPDFCFIASQPAHYSELKHRHPALFGRIRDLIAAERWEAVGPTWVEIDTLLPSGEALVRQFLHGSMFLEQEFGSVPPIVFLPDSAGFSPALPQIAASAGCRYMVTQKLEWNEFNEMPHNTFWWEGQDGTRLLAHIMPSATYNGSMLPSQLNMSRRRFRDHERTARSLYLFAWGDGGRGPDEEMLSRARHLENLEGAPRVSLTTTEQFFKDIEAEAAALPVWVGELYLERHRGIYTSQAHIKQLNRRAEAALVDAETWSVLAGRRHAASDIENLWPLLLVNQNHDVLPGTAIDWVIDESAAELRHVIAAAGASSVESCTSLATGDEAPDKDLTNYAIFNPASHSRHEVVLIDGREHRILVPPCGFRVVSPDPEEREYILGCDSNTLENSKLRIQWDDSGSVNSIWDKEADREVLSRKGGNFLELIPDHPAHSDAWEIDPYSSVSHPIRATIIKIEPQRMASARAGVRFVWRIGNSHVEQLMTLDAESRAIRFDCAVDWTEERRLLRVGFDLKLHTRTATCETQFGFITRPTHYNTTWELAKYEVWAHRWVDLNEFGYGVALLNESKYGYSLCGSAIRLSLLRSPLHPDPRADRGSHHMTYILMPHTGDFREAGVALAAEDLNRPLTVVRSNLPAGTEGSLLRLDTEQIIVSAVKFSSGDHRQVIIRVYESWGGSCTGELTIALPVARAWACDVLERPRQEIAVSGGGRIVLHLRPFEVLTLKLESER